ncbi:hypothetical protein KI387_044604 [Taxus chinensis]|uniref:Retrotransposon gag domain-containing protein n=1 Tax=Taxus chinensis TaxID=29808 RepID=A0AA38CJP6_TAXCH|nr:hypothetical protein KI387_044604 [Taxus chinensis]
MNPPLTPQQNIPFASYTGHINMPPPQSDVVQLLFKKIADLEASTKGAHPSYSFEEVCNEPIHPLVAFKPYPPQWELPKFSKFHSREDPQQHLRAFKHAYYLIVQDQELMLRTFPMSLAGPALDWYNNIPQHSLFSFSQLAQMFVENFSINITHKISITDLYNIRQFDDESIADFVTRWRGIINQLSFSLPQSQQIELFTRSCANHISSTLRIQTFHTFEEAFTMARKLESRAIEQGKLKLHSKSKPDFSRFTKSNPSASNKDKNQGSANAIVLKTS